MSMFGNKSKPESHSNTKAPGAAAPVAVEKAAGTVPTPQPKNVIAQGTVIEGNILMDGELQLEGTVKGDIRTSGKLVVGNDAFVEGNIYAAQAEVAGRITGTVECSGLLNIKASCIITGDIITKSLNVESGSTFDGRCKVGATSRNISSDRKESLNPARSPETSKGKSPALVVETAGSGSALL